MASPGVGALFQKIRAVPEWVNDSPKEHERRRYNIAFSLSCRRGHFRVGT